MKNTLEPLWKEFSGKLENFLRTKVGDPAVAEDLRQDVFLRLLQRLERGGSVGDVEAWLFRSARNAVIDHYRTRKATVAVPETLPDESVPEPAELEELRASFRRMISSLPEPYREAVTLVDLEGMKQQDFADRLGISLSAAKSRVQRGRDLLRGMLRECCTFGFDRRGRVIDCEPRSSARYRECCGGTGQAGGNFRRFLVVRPAQGIAAKPSRMRSVTLGVCFGVRRLVFAFGAEAC